MNAHQSSVRGFTLIELLTVIGVLAVVISVTAIILNPGELFAQARDAQRIADLARLSATIEFMRVEQKNVGSPAQVVYTSLQASTADCAQYSGQLQALELGWSFHCSVADPKLTDGTGWLPFSFVGNATAAAMSVLPLDPRQSVVGQRYYKYIKGSRGFEFVGTLESVRYRAEEAAKDGGVDSGAYETGSNLKLWDAAAQEAAT